MLFFAKAKNKEIKIEKWVIGEFYDLADYYGYDDNGSVASREVSIKNILDNIFGGDIEETQRLIELYTEDNFKLLSRKNQERADRSLVA